MIESSKLYLVTGGSGFLGESLIERILNNGGRVRVLARSEKGLIELKMKFPNIEIITGDVADRVSVSQAMKGVDGGIFHLAAFKHVGLAETQARECVLSNTVGSLNILEEALLMPTPLDFIIGISTDKAAQVAGIYGATKLLMEGMFQQFAGLMPNTKLRLVRYGNVLYSTGSVLCKWRKVIEDNGKFIVTDRDATRFYWTVEQAVDLIFDCLENAPDTHPWCPTMKSLSVGDLLEALVEKYGNNCVWEIEEIGLQPGENMHERILEDGPSSDEVERYTIEEIKDLI